MEFTINARQAILILWTLFGIIISIVVAVSLVLVYPTYYVPWQLLLGVFFGLLLAVILPVYLFLALWHWLSKPETET